MMNAHRGGICSVHYTNTTIHNTHTMRCCVSVHYTNTTTNNTYTNATSMCIHHIVYAQVKQMDFTNQNAFLLQGSEGGDILTYTDNCKKYLQEYVCQ